MEVSCTCPPGIRAMTMGSMMRVRSISQHEANDTMTEEVDEEKGVSASASISPGNASSWGDAKSGGWQSGGDWEGGRPRADSIQSVTRCQDTNGWKTRRHSP
ncbi:hypothetical protein KIPB_010875 [Kipferlia bialata]|uniref:Uncharacterized protein n=1 Tax=Kipferlia bialata TaxID=797122 RepID=A0A391NQ48_9EUKA|nr:hypothetical protein KIPB_010875 [Kipferlia bialata]|eukprot:g10875.t1